MVPATSRQHVKPRVQRGHAKELQPRLAGAALFGEERVELECSPVRHRDAVLRVTEPRQFPEARSPAKTRGREAEGPRPRARERLCQTAVSDTSFRSSDHANRSCAFANPTRPWSKLIHLGGTDERFMHGCISDDLPRFRVAGARRRDRQTEERRQDDGHVDGWRWHAVHQGPEDADRSEDREQDAQCPSSTPAANR